MVDLNKANETQGYFIETDEREELCDFIDKAARSAGYSV